MKNKHIIRITENDIHSMIKECIHNVLVEGYSGKHFKDKVASFSDKLYKYIVSQKEKGVVGEQKLTSSISINLKPFKTDRDLMQKKYLSGNKIPVDVVIDYGDDASEEVSGKSVRSGGSFRIKLFVSSNTTYDRIFYAMLHEVTHSVDKLMKDYMDSWTGARIGSDGKPHSIGKYRGYHHQVREENGLPTWMQYIMYYLWDTAEFTAYQSNYQSVYGDLSTFVERLMELLEKAQQCNDPEIWEDFKDYFTTTNSLPTFGDTPVQDPHKKDFRNVSWKNAKKYFIKTSFNKLKKFIQKTK